MKRNIKIQKNNSKELAEFIGILYGDGCVNCYPRYKYVIEIVGHSKNDVDYHKNYIKPLVKKLFNIEPRLGLKKGQNTLYTQIISKEIFEFLKSVGVPTGKKISLIVPRWIKYNQEYFIAFTRGLFDTDGSVIVRKRGQHSISLGLKNKELIDEVKSFLESLNYFVAYNVEQTKIRGTEFTSYRIRINRKKLIKRFMMEIGSSNPYKIERLKRIGGAGGI